MQVRLAFAVAAHLQPEILLIDEVLAVGDAEFQKKCLGKMEDVTKEGRTVVFVSHNMAAVRSLCPRSIVLEQGRLSLTVRPTRPCSTISGNDAQRHGSRATSSRASDGREAVRIGAGARCHAMGILDETGMPRASFRSDEEISIVVDYECLKAVKGVTVIVDLVDRSGTRVLRSESIDDLDDNQSWSAGDTARLASCLPGSSDELTSASRARVRSSPPHRRVRATLSSSTLPSGPQRQPRRRDATLRPSLAGERRRGLASTVEAR